MKTLKMLALCLKSLEIELTYDPAEQTPEECKETLEQACLLLLYSQ